MPSSVSFWLVGLDGGIGTDSSLAPLFQLTFHSFTSGTYPIYQKRRLTPPTPASLLGVHILRGTKAVANSLWLFFLLKGKDGLRPCSSRVPAELSFPPQGQGCCIKMQDTGSTAKSVSYNPAPSPSPGARLLPESLNFPSVDLWGAQSRSEFTTHPPST